MGDEGHFPLVSILDMNVVVPPSDVKLGEDLGVFYLVDEVLDQWEGIRILNSVGVDISIVLAGSESVRSSVATVWLASNQLWKTDISYDCSSCNPWKP